MAKKTKQTKKPALKVRVKAMRKLSTEQLADTLGGGGRPFTGVTALCNVHYTRSCCNGC